MPSTEDIFEAQNQVKKWAMEQLEKEGHILYNENTGQRYSAHDAAVVLVNRMTYEQRVKIAEKLRGPIYRGAYSAF